MSSADTRTAHTDAGDTLGTIIGATEKRDAIHLAVEPVQCDVRLKPGDHVLYVGNNTVEKAEKGHGHGIVDPFLQKAVAPGEWFWFVMYPRQIRSLRHVWTHPAFEDEASVAKPAKSYRDMTVQEKKALALIGCPEAMADIYIQELARRLDVEVDELLEATENHITHGDYWVDGGKFEGYSIPHEYWAHYAIFTGNAVNESDQHSFLSCSCCTTQPRNSLCSQNTCKSPSCKQKPWCSTLCVPRSSRSFAARLRSANRPWFMTSP